MLPRQVELLELSLRDSRTECQALAAKLALSEEGSGVLRAELASVKSEQVHLQRTSDLASSARVRHRDEIARLQRRVEELSRSEELAGALREQLSSMERKLGELAKVYDGGRVGRGRGDLQARLAQLLSGL